MLTTLPFTHKNLKILVTLDILEETRSGDPSVGLCDIDEKREGALRRSFTDFFYPYIPHIIEEGCFKDRISPEYKEPISYVTDYLLDSNLLLSEGNPLKEFYTMKIVSNTDNELCLKLILKKGFLTCMGILPSEKRLELSQEILHILFDSKTSNRDFTRHYMTLLLSGENSIKNILAFFFTGDTNEN